MKARQYCIQKLRIFYKNSTKFFFLGGGRGAPIASLKRLKNIIRMSLKSPQAIKRRIYTSLRSLRTNIKFLLRMRYNSVCMLSSVLFSSCIFFGCWFGCVVSSNIWLLFTVLSISVYNLLMELSTCENKLIFVVNSCSEIESRYMYVFL